MVMVAPAAAVMDAQSVAGDDSAAVFFERRFHVGERVHCGVWAHLLVGVKPPHHALARGDLNRHDLRFEVAGGNGSRGALLALQRRRSCMPRVMQ